MHAAQLPSPSARFIYRAVWSRGLHSCIFHYVFLPIFRVSRTPFRAAEGPVEAKSWGLMHQYVTVTDEYGSQMWVSIDAWQENPEVIHTKFT